MQTLTPFEQMKVKRFEERFGEMSSLECLECALNDEQIAKDCGPFDPVSGRFYQSLHDMMEYAILQEKQGK